MHKLWTSDALPPQSLEGKKANMQSLQQAPYINPHLKDKEQFCKYFLTNWKNESTRLVKISW